MNILTIDFETAYGGDLGFAKQTTEEYIRDPRFEVIGVAVQVNDGEPEWFSGTHQKLYSFLNKYDWKNSIALAHNAVFDGAILNWQFGITPKGWLDTLSMGRALHGTQVGGSLAVLAQHYGIGVKGEQVKQYINYFRKNFTEEELADYGVYCKNDVALTWDLYGHMSQGFPASELRLIDLTVRMFTEPVLQLDKDLLQAHLVAEQKRKAAILDRFDKDTLMSNPQFANMLVSFGVQPPMKKSPANGKQTFAFSKTDEEFKALLEHPDIGVQAVVAARLGTKSTIEETRTERFIGIAKRGPMPD
jgi:DNA polymerase III epsilon subunit-like protein